jgi:excisionase family DNA binding protein
MSAPAVADAYERGRADEAALAAAPVPAADPEYLTRKEAAEHLRVSLTTVNGLIQTGELGSVTIRARRFVPRSALTAYLAIARS